MSGSIYWEPVPDYVGRLDRAIKENRKKITELTEKVEQLMAKKQVRPDWADLPPSETGVDEECVALCEAMNKFPGIETVESCCGHGVHNYRIFFRAETLDNLPSLLYFFDQCHSGCHGWRVIAKTDCSMCPVSFMAEGPIGEKAYEDSKTIANIMEEWLAG